MNKNDISGPISIGNDEEITFFELAEQIIDLTGSKSIIEYKISQMIIQL